MPKKLSRATDQRIYDRLATLNRHMRSCKPCTAARKSMDPSMMCSQGALMTLQAAHYFNDIVRLRIAAHTQYPDAIYACPDISMHGATYALTATPYMVTAIQDALF